ncbi:MAG: hypothetical protein ACRC1U_00660, partial [Vibrionaceae bacterium]
MQYDNESTGGVLEPTAQIASCLTVSSLALSFSEQAIDNCQDPVLKRFLRMINSESNERRRAFLIVKAMRVFKDAGELFTGVLNRLGYLLNIDIESVAGWRRIAPQATVPATSGAAAHAGVTASRGLLCMPVDIFTWPELLNLIEENLSSQHGSAVLNLPQDIAGPSASRTAEAEQAALVSGLSFSQSFIGAQPNDLKALLNEFEQQQNASERRTLFIKIICILHEEKRIPDSIYRRVCQLLGIDGRGTRNWLRGFMNARTAAVQGAQASLPAQQSVATPLSLLTSQPSTMPFARSATVTPVATTMPTLTPPAQTSAPATVTLTHQFAAIS